MDINLWDNNMASGFRRKLLFWYDENHRDLPWRRECDPYRIWLSEVMLQQTRVEAATPYYHRFLAAYPDLSTLAAAGQDEVLKLWEGLGYYSRARNFLQAVREVQETYSGCVPQEPELFGALPGVGTYTKAAVCSIAFGKPLAVVDGNVKRVFCRLFAIMTDSAKTVVQKQIQSLAQAILDTDRPGDFNQAVMELGALICIPRSPRCGQCPVVEYCRAQQEGIAASLPIKSTKKPLSTVCLAAAVVIWGGRVLVRQRVEAGLLNGLWEFPNVVIQDDSQVDFSALLGDKARVGEELMKLSHTFSHLHWQVYVFRVDDVIIDPCGHPWLWAGNVELAKLAFPAVYHPLLERVRTMVK